MKKSIKYLLLATALSGLAPLTSFADVFVSVSFAPPVLPVYEQPACPGNGYLWTPGYWAFADGAYYWVPGTWVVAPAPGLLWTPGYWAFESAAYFWHPGYWGPQVGFYGGVNYGYGYSGAGYQGGYWNHNVFNYNRTVNNINVTNVTNVYNTYSSPVVNNNPGNHVAYNGGAGLQARPDPQEQQAMREPHYQWTHGQLQNEETARSDPYQRVSFNHGHPGVFATPTPAAFHGPGAVTQGRQSPEPAMPQPPHAPTIVYDQGGRRTQEGVAAEPATAQRAPEYRYEHEAPQPYRQAQPVQYQRPETDRPSWPTQQAPHPETSSYSYRDQRPQAYYPPTMAQRHDPPSAPVYRNPAPGEFRQTSQAPQRDRAPSGPRPSNQPPSSQQQARKPDGSHPGTQWRTE